MHGKYKNFQEIVTLWRATFEYRQNVLEDPQRDFKSLLSGWNVLKLPPSHILVRIIKYLKIEYTKQHEKIFVFVLSKLELDISRVFL